MYVAELIIYLLLLVLFYLYSGVHTLFKGLSRGMQIFILFFVYMLVFGQVYKAPRVTYPLTVWGMYSEVTPYPNYYEYQIELEDGSVEHYPFEIITFTSQRAFMRKIEYLERGSREDDRRELLHQTVEGLVRIYETEFPDKKITQFSINEVSISLNDSEKRYGASNTNRFTKVMTP